MKYILRVPDYHNFLTSTLNISPTVIFMFKIYEKAITKKYDLFTTKINELNHLIRVMFSWNYRMTLFLILAPVNGTFLIKIYMLCVLLTVTKKLISDLQ